MIAMDEAMRSLPRQQDLQSGVVLLLPLPLRWRRRQRAGFGARYQPQGHACRVRRGQPT